MNQQHARRAQFLVVATYDSLRRRPRGRAFAFTYFLVILLIAFNTPAVEFSTVSFAGQRFTICRVNVRKEHLQLFLRDGHGQPFNRFDRLSPWLESQGSKLLFAMNAGMYRNDFSPVGLFVAGGVETTPLNTSKGSGNFYLKPNGVFALTSDGAHIIDTADYARFTNRLICATQSGPLLVRHGELHPAFNRNSNSRFLRNGVGVASSDIAVFAISETLVNFYEMATLFRDQLHCPDALFLDGAVSSLYAPELKRCDSRADLGPLIGVTE